MKAALFTPLLMQAILSGRFAVLLTLIGEGLASKSQAAGGDLDPSFGSNGKVTTDFAGESVFAVDIELDVSGRILLAGWSEGEDDFALARYTPSGSLDASFGSGGRVLTDFDGNDNQINAVAIDGSGRIVAVGINWHPVQFGAHRDFALARYTPSGALDNTFGNGGKVITDFNGFSDVAVDVTIDSNGRILVAGYSPPREDADPASTGYDFLLARYTSSGALDNSFGTGGFVRTDFFGGDDYGNAVLIDYSGRIVVAGRAIQPAIGQSQAHFALARYTPDGVLDTAFSSDGKVTSFFSHHGGDAASLDDSGRILVAGHVSGAALGPVRDASDFMVVRYTTSGSLDTTFGSGGKATADISGGFDEALAMALSPSGRIYVGGWADSNQPAGNDFAIACFTSGGSLDTSFGTGGITTTDFSGQADYGAGLAIDGDGKVLLAGATGDFLNRDFALARYLTDAPGISLRIGGTTIASGGSYNFGSEVIPGLERSVTVTITNTGDAPLTGIAALITPVSSEDFRVGTPPPPATIAAGASGTFSVIFSPQVAGNRTGSLQVAGNAAPNPYIIQLSGTGADLIPPVITTPAESLTIIGGAAGNSAAVSNWLASHGGATATDNISTVSWSHNFNSEPLPGSSSVITFRAADASGNFSTTAAQLIVLDQTPPVITSEAAGLTIVCDAPGRMDMVNTWLTAHGTAAATDNSGTVIWSHNFTALPGACATGTITFTARDGSGNTSTTAAQLNSVDNTAPVIMVAAVGLTVESNGSGNATQRSAWLSSYGGASATDSCTAVTWTHNFTGLAHTLPQTVPVIFSANDACGNSSTTSANFIIQDTTPPALTVPAAPYYGDCDEAAADIADFLATRSGAQAVDIAGPVTWTHDYNGTLPDCMGHITVTFTATDTVGLSVSTTTRFFLFPPGAVWIGPATGSWNTAAAWRSQIPTAALDTYVDLFDFQDTTVTSLSSAVVKNLFVGAGDTLTVSSSPTGSSLTVHGDTIHNAGTIRLDSSPGGSSHLFIRNAINLTGTGKVILSGAGQNAIERGTGSATDVLTVASGQEITTSAGSIGEYLKTSIDAGIVNHGTITADQGGLFLFSNSKTNHGTFRAINGGTLRMNVPIHNTTGTLSADAAGVLNLRSTLNGGLVTGDGVLRMDATATLNGPLTLGPDLTTAVDAAGTFLSGTITNDGLMTLGTPTGPAGAYLYINGAVTLEGSGKVLIQGNASRLIERGNSAVTDVLTVAAGQEITTSAGTIGEYLRTSIDAGIVNYGMITADQGGLFLFTLPKTNHGTFRAINGGTLRMQVPILNTGGTLSADAASVLELRSTLNGGVVTGQGVLRMNATATLNGPLSLGAELTTAVDAAGTFLSGTITNNGLLTLGTPAGPAAAYLYLNGAVTLEGNGKVLIQGNATRQIERGNGAATDVLTLAAGQELSASAGTVAGNTAFHAGLINHGTITADQGGLSLLSVAKTNHATFRAINGGTLQVSSPLTNYAAATSTLTGGRWEVISAASPTLMDLAGKPITTLAAGTTVRLSGAGASLPQLSGLRSITGTLMLENGKTLATTGNMVVPGKLQYGLPAALNTTRIAITGSVDFNGGTVDIADLGMTTGSYILATWTGSVTGAPTLGIRPPGMTHSLVVDATAKQLRLEILVIPQVDITTWTVVPGTGPNAGMNVVTLGGTGHPNAGYVLEATTDLQNWTALSGVLTSPTGAISWQFTEPATLTRRCYRFLLQQ